MEYWPLQLKKKGPRDHRPLLGRVAVVTGAGGAIGLGVADRLLEAGADVALTDVSEERLAKAAHLLGLKHGPERLAAVPFDITRMDQVENGFDAIGRLLGGLDILVPNAGIAHVARIEDLDTETVSRVMAVNFLGVFHGIKAAVPIFRRQGTGGHVVIISSKNVFDPGASFSAYSSSKAAAHQMGKIAAMELAPMGVRVNMINPDAVFGCGDVSSGLWDLVGPDRMRSRGLDPSCMADYYRDRNLLKARVTAEHVGNAVVFFASDLVPTTGATLTVDGGVTGAFPR
jgi:NAD(P)-dependent dehydrogenase (short-subunit alcohol dehydrogenase family)